MSLWHATSMLKGDGYILSGTLMQYKLSSLLSYFKPLHYKPLKNKVTFKKEIINIIKKDEKGGYEFLHNKALMLGSNDLSTKRLILLNSIFTQFSS